MKNTTMNTLMLRLVGVLAALILFALPATSQIEKKAQVGFRFLENPVSAEAIGRGGVGVVSTFNATGIFWNPALISRNDALADIAVHHTTGIADINYNAGAASIRVGSFGVLAVSVLAMDYGDFYGTRRANNNEGYVDTEVFSPQAYAIGLAFSQSVSDRFSYGVHLKRVTQDLGNAWVAPVGGAIDDPTMPISAKGYEATEYAVDVGAYYDFGYNGIRFAATLQNISREIRYENDPFPMPFAVSFGATVEPIAFFLEGEDARVLVLSFESKHPRDFNEKFKVGAEYSIMEVLRLRVGYMSNYDERGFTAGLGVRHAFDGLPLRLDYAYQPFGIFGTVHHLTLGISY